MADQKSIILEQDKIRRITQRMAFEILENTYDEKSVLLIGINERGLSFAKSLGKVLKKHAEFEIEVAGVVVNTPDPTAEEVQLTYKKDLKNKVILLIDDVANTGKTMFYALKPLMETSPKKILIAVLVDRRHKTFPICPDFIGLSLSTTLQEHIEVEFEKDVPKFAFLV